MTKTDRAEKALAELEQSVLKLQKKLRATNEAHIVQLRPELLNKMKSQAQFMGINDVDRLTGMVLEAFLDLAREEKWLKLPLMFQEVDSA